MPGFISDGPLARGLVRIGDEAIAREYDTKLRDYFAEDDGPFIESKEHLGGFAVVDVADEGAAVGRKDRGGLRLAAGGATLPGPHATSGDFLTESAGVPVAMLYYVSL